MDNEHEGTEEQEEARLAEADLPQRCYLVVPDPEKRSTWKLPVCDDSGQVTVQKLGNAAAALSPGGFRGQQVEITDTQRRSAISKLRSLYREHKAEPPKSLREDAPLLSDGVLIESADNGEGWMWRVQIIQAGVSKNKTEYPLSVLHSRAGLYEGVPAYYGKAEGHPTERGFDAVAGYIVDPKPNPKGIEATFAINRGKPELRESFMQGWQVYQKTGRMPFGFSHVVPAGKYRVSVKQLAEGTVRRIEDFTEVESVDIVMRPSAGGELLGLVAAVDARQERSVQVMDELVRRLRAGERLSEAELQQVRGELSPEDYAAALEAGIDARQNATATVDTRVLDEATKAVEAAEQRIKLLECRSLLAEKLTEAKSLPEAVKDNIRIDFNGRVFEAEELTKRIERDTAMAAKLLEAAGASIPNTGSVEVTSDQSDKWRKAMDGLISGRAVDGVKPFRTLKEAYRIMVPAGRKLEYIDPRLSRLVLGEAQGYIPADWSLEESIDTSTFDQILGDSITRRMIQEYQYPQYQSWRLIAAPPVPLTDFRTQRRVRMGGYGDLPKVLQGAPYQPLNSPTDEEATYAPEKHGGTEDLTIEMIANDDVGAVRRIPVNLGRAAARTLYKAVWVTTIQGNATCTYDSTTLFHANHGNTDTKALSAANLLAVENAMRDQTNLNSTDVLGAGNMPVLLVIPNELRDTAHKLVVSNAAVTSNEDATTPNIFRGRYREPVVIDEWTDATDWFAFADPSQTPVLEVGFMDGREEPELFVQDQQTSGSVFSADKLTYKIRHIWAIGVIDHRGAYRNVVA